MNDITRKFVRKKIEESGMSQVEIAERLKMTPSHISRLLSGERDTTLETLIEIADVLKIDRSYLLRLASGLNPEPDSDEWVKDMSHKITLIPVPFRGVTKTFIDSMVEGEQQQGKPKPRKNNKPAHKGVGE